MSDLAVTQSDLEQKTAELDNLRKDIRERDSKVSYLTSSESQLQKDLDNLKQKLADTE